MVDGQRTNPNALSGAPNPRIDYLRVAGTSLYTEVRGSGPAILLIGAADEDAEFYRPIAERLADEFTVVTYDRRGTRRSGREDWPGGGSSQHADDAAALLSALALHDVTVMGASAGAIVAPQLALRHPGRTATTLCFEPGSFCVVPGGAEFQRSVGTLVDDHLELHPGDWAGAVAALGQAAVESTEAGAPGFFTPPPGQEWYGERADANAESFVRGDMALTGEAVDDDAVSACPVNLRFAHGTESLPIFQMITTHLAATRGTTPDALQGIGHSLFYHPEAAATYIRDSIARA